MQCEGIGVVTCTDPCPTCGERFIHPLPRPEPAIHPVQYLGEVGSGCCGDHAAPACNDPFCWIKTPLSPSINSSMIMFRTPDGEAVYLDETEAGALARDLLSMVIELKLRRGRST